MQTLAKVVAVGFSDPLYSGRIMLGAQVRLWRSSFWEVWYPLPLDKKLIWIAFITNTTAILTLIELIFLK